MYQKLNFYLIYYKIIKIFNLILNKINQSMANSVILVTGSYDNTLIFWDPFTGRKTHVQDYPQDVLNLILVSCQ